MGCRPPADEGERSRTEHSRREEERTVRTDYRHAAPGALQAMGALQRYTPRERAALAWTEAVTLISQGGVSDELHEMVRKQFTEKELVDLTMAVVTINGWNRLAISLGSDVGSLFQ